MRHTFSVEGLPDGATLELPYVDVTGPRSGPHLTVLAGVHGTECSSIAAVRDFARSLDSADSATLSGRITAVPLVNPATFWARSPFIVPVDGKNLNRCFPGDPGGSYTEVLAYRVFQQFIVGSDYLIDLHGGDIPEVLEPFAIYDESPVEEAAHDLAVAYGLGHIIRQPAAGRTVGGSTHAAAAEAGIPAIVAEAGQNGILDRTAVETHLAGLANVLVHLGMTAGERARGLAPSEHPGWSWLRTPVSGWWEPAVATGQSVRAGERLGLVSDLLGAPRHEVLAPAAGVALFLTSSPAVAADGLLLGLALDPDR